jgi:putative hydrolase of the HAD superfamily
VLRGVIFDLFHTLTGPESVWSDLPSTSEVLGIDRRAWDDVLIRRSRWRLCGAERDPYTIVRMLAHDIDPSIPEERLREALKVRIQRFRDSLMRVPVENIAALKRLRESGLRLGLISNADAMEVAAWAESPLAGCFDAEIFSCDAGAVKPEPAIFAQCLDALGLPAADCLFVGDGGSDELAGAKTVGLSTVFVSGVMAELWPERVAERLAISDHHIIWLPEILTIARI